MIQFETNNNPIYNNSSNSLITPDNKINRNYHHNNTPPYKDHQHTVINRQIVISIIIEII